MLKIDVFKGRACTTSSQFLRPATSSVAVCSGKRSQKNDGLYFEYEEVDQEAAKQIPIERERLKDEFSWVQRARQSAQVHKNRRQTAETSKGRQSGWKSRAKSLQQRQESLQPTTTSTPETSRGNEVSPSATHLVAEEVGQNESQDVSFQQRPSSASTTTEQETGRALHVASSRKERLMQRMQGSSPAGHHSPGKAESEKAAPAAAAVSSRMPAAVAVPVTAAAAAVPVTAAAVAVAVPVTAAAVAVPVTAAAAVAVATAAPSSTRPSVSATGHSDLQQLLFLEEEGDKKQALRPLPSVPDLGALDDEEENIKELLQGVFVDGLESESLGNEDVSGSGAGGLSMAVSRESAAQRQFEEWVKKLKEGGFEGEEKDEAELAALEAFVDAQGEDEVLEDMMDDKSEDEEERMEDMPDVASLLKSASIGLSEFKALAEQLAEEDALLEELREGVKGSSLGAGVGVGGTEGVEDSVLSDEKVLSSLRLSDPDLYELLVSTPGGQDDEDLLRMLTAGDEASSSLFSGSQGFSLEDEKELAALLKSEKDVDGSSALLGEDDEEQQEAELSELFDAIDEDEDLEPQQKMKAMYSLQGIFNAPAEEASTPPSKSNPKAQQSQAISNASHVSRGPTTTGTAAKSKTGTQSSSDSKEEPPPPLLNRPQLKR
ncbi:hypothetical protein CEUSTIGMA_g5090.t1 [Chlamydomonas eustigma]|uniref:Uncharacterized protein n=1 Tax=Chlamydomonas eustigma TaxID=1157962 RepID=A0A250X3K0_9CHLO|nr:hypothetical protein CEUSTIGMA_g5090.t1 [Chlamydomonas eustigma]|eukprot:GAX77647.1 hypothetical protein CEUSTIGMA_g5090.t1 [Chlamydomonas eustigma]